MKDTAERLNTHVLSFNCLDILAIHTRDCLSLQVAISSDLQQHSQ